MVESNNAMYFAYHVPESVFLQRLCVPFVWEIFSANYLYCVFEQALRYYSQPFAYVIVFAANVLILFYSRYIDTHSPFCCYFCCLFALFTCRTLFGIVFWFDTGFRNWMKKEATVLAMRLNYRFNALLLACRFHHRTQFGDQNQYFNLKLKEAKKR